VVQIVEIVVVGVVAAVEEVAVVVGVRNKVREVGAVAKISKKPLLVRNCQMLQHSQRLADKLLSSQNEADSRYMPS